MTDERIKEILEDPNTWDWDGCTYPETDPYSEDFYKERNARVQRLKKLVEEERQKG